MQNGHVFCVILSHTSVSLVLQEEGEIKTHLPLPTFGKVRILVCDCFFCCFHQIRDELCKETLQLARENLEKEPRIMELRNQCRIIRTTELAAAQEKLNELEKQKEELLRSCSPASFLQRLQEAMNKTEEESDAFHRQFLDKEIDLGAFVQKYKKLRTTYHKRALIHLAAKASPTG
ncbi:hypothetical protein H0E87_026761 [Populus deltoides]|uniref:VPS37 C-terminal domain-containing protein n=1 Tax=Populus deltoides TaxID=3696 RepID=A0A8T2WY71_POPDE|nr:hypothetical protein H0E87_026761 [Populus deltoides]KAH8485113.1 hypothetical protein H0E87_026761 [Populus deltoides]